MAKKTVYFISLSCQTDDQNDFAKLAETLARTAAGVAFDGMTASVSMFATEEEEES